MVCKATKCVASHPKEVKEETGLFTTLELVLLHIIL
jgi:hypothetical protein